MVSNCNLQYHRITHSLIRTHVGLITCVLLQLLIVSWTSSFLWSSLALSCFLLTASFCLTWAPAPLVCGWFEHLLGVSALLDPFGGSVDGSFLLRGLILTSVLVRSFRWRLSLRGLASTAEVGGSNRSFLRGVSLMLVSVSDAVFFLLIGVVTSWITKERQRMITSLLELQSLSTVGLDFVNISLLIVQWWRRQCLHSYTVHFGVSRLLACCFLLWFCQRVQVLLGYNLNLRRKTDSEILTVTMQGTGLIRTNLTFSVSLKDPYKEDVSHLKLTFHLVKSLTELGPYLTCWRTVLTNFVSNSDIFSAVMGSGRVKLFSQTPMI